jgi:S-disulfanyl-L-cysteine oxidoreductase SoxD
MFWRNEIIAVATVVASLVSLAHAYDFGRPATAEEIKLWDIDVRPDGTGLPEGSGTVARGKSVYEENCEACHGPSGQGGIKDRLAGGQGSLATESPVKTVGSYWPYATTLFDYIKRAMPWTSPRTLTDDQVYALTAYILAQNKLIDARQVINAQTLPKVQMPNRNGFTPRFPERMPPG